MDTLDVDGDALPSEQPSINVIGVAMSLSSNA
jgi:hypothetical protein